MAVCIRSWRARSSGVGSAGTSHKESWRVGDPRPLAPTPINRTGWPRGQIWWNKCHAASAITKAFVWRMGWGRGHFQEHGGKGVPIYTGIPMDCTPHMVEERKLPDVHQRPRDATQLPWTMDELIDSTWVNTWTGTMHIVTALYCNRGGQPEPGWQCQFSGVYAYIKRSWGVA